jgi:O-antigen/teichoic acid export membrane protein
MRWPFGSSRSPLGSRFARNVWLVTRANVLAQALPVLAAPLLTRLYGPEAFGALALFAAALGLALSVATARTEWSVPNARSKAMAAALLALGALALGLSCIVLAMGLLLWPGAAGDLPPAAAWLLLPALAGAGLQQLVAAWHVRSAELAGVGRAKVMQSIGIVGVSLGAAPWLPVGPWGLLLGVLAGAWIGLRTLWRTAAGLGAALCTLSWRRVAVARRRFASEAGWSTLVSACNAASFAAVPLLLARHYDAAEVGFYALMQRVVLGPVGLVGQAVSQSFWSEAARLVREDSVALARLHAGTTRKLLWLSLPLAVLAIAGPWYVGPIFGAAQWSGAGIVLAACAPMLVGQVAVSPLSHLVIHRRQHWQAVWDLVRLAALAVAIEVAGRAGASLAGAVLALSLVMAVMYAVLWFMNRYALRRAGW